MLDYQGTVKVGRSEAMKVRFYTLIAVNSSKLGSDNNLQVDYCTQIVADTIKVFPVSVSADT